MKRTISTKRACKKRKDNDDELEHARGELLREGTCTKRNNMTRGNMHGEEEYNEEEYERENMTRRNTHEEEEYDQEEHARRGRI